MKKYTLALAVLLCVNTMFAQRMLTLEESKQLALQHNYRIKNSILEMEAAGETKKAAFTSFFPSLSAGGYALNAQKNLMELSVGGGALGLLKSGTLGMVSLVQPVYAGGRIWNGNKLASLSEDVSEYKSRLARNEVLLKTEEQYWLVVVLKEKMKTIHAYEEFLDSLLRQVEDAYASGLVMKNDLLKVRLKRSEVLLNKSKLENGIKLATMAFCQHVNIPYDPTLVLVDSLSTGDLPQTYYVDHKEALGERTEYKLLQSSVRAEELQTRLKRGEYLPQAGIGVGGIYMKIDDGKDRTVGMVYGTVQIPISGWWAASHTLAERKAQEQIARNGMKDQSELLLLQMEKAWQDFTDAYKQVLLSDDTQKQAEENLKVNEDGYKNGMISVSDLLEAQAMLQQAKDQLNDAKANCQTKKINYLQVTGR